MQEAIIFGLFILGTIMGSFFNVVASRLPNGESIIKPPSHCPKCKHRLGPLELIPVVSYLFQGGKCKSCKVKMSIFYPISEVICGLLYVICFISFGISFELIIAITFISMIVIIVLSDYYYYIINDSVLIVFGLLLLLEIFIFKGFNPLLYSLINGIIAFIVMLLLKLFGDFLFKKESMGGGDIKLMFIFGLVIGAPMAIISIFFASIIALPISIIILKKNKEHILPFGPYLSMGALIIFFTHLNLDIILSALNFLSI